MNYLSFSLWGDNPIYNVGAIKNARLWRAGLYSGWKMVVYYDNSVPKQTIDALNYIGAKTIDVTSENMYGMFWSFLAVSLPEAQNCCFRDCDSRISLREKLAVDVWIGSGKSLHVMRDHPSHIIPYGNNELGILGGMWGIKSGAIPLKDMVIEYTQNKNLSYGSDQTFLAKVYELLINDRRTHDEFAENFPFPMKRKSGVFVGGRVDENDRPIGNDYMLVML